MRAASAAVFLVVRLLVMGPDGTETLSEHKANLLPGVTGLIKENLEDPDFPATVHLYLTPSAPGAVNKVTAINVAVRSELWSAPGGARSGAVPDERNLDQITIFDGSSLVQIAVNAESGRRLVLSISAPEEEPPPPPLPMAPSNPVPVTFDVRLFRTQESVREPVSVQRLRTLAGRPVSWENSWRRPVNKPGERPIYIQEGVTLTLTPLQVSDGWVSVEAKITARVVKDGLPGTEPREISSTTSRTMTYGIPFDVTLATGSGGKRVSGEEEEGQEPAPELVLNSITVLRTNSH